MPFQNHPRTLTLAAVLISLLTASSLPAQTIYEQMQVRSPTPTPSHLTRLRYGAGKFLAVGEFGALVSSDDGVTWTAHPTGYARSLSDIAFGNGVYVACGRDNRTLLTSFDLAAWNITTPTGIPFNCLAITFHDGRFYVCGSGGEIASSADGATWTPATTGVSAMLNDILFAGGQFLCVGADNTVLTSPDGVTWTARPTGVALSGLKAGLLSVSWLNDRYLVGGKDGAILTSPDGINWTLQSYTGNDWFYGGIYANGAYHLTGRQGKLRKTTDFTTWEDVSTANAADNDLYGVLTQEGITVVVGRNGTINTSPGLVQWTSRQGGYSQSFSGLVFGQGTFVACDFDGVIRTSPDGVAWTDVFTLPGDGGLNDLAFGDGKFVAVSSASEITQSADGQLWSAPVKQFDGFPSTQKVRFLNGRWFLLGRNGLLRSSANLSDWTVSDVAVTGRINDLIFANNRYVAVGDNGAIFTSVDGLTFEVQTSGTTKHLNTVAYGNGRFVVGGSGVTVLTSVNGIDWTADGVSFPPANINLLFHREGQFVAFATSGQLGLSADGQAWTTVSLGVPGLLTRFAEGNDRLVAVGNNGLLMSTDPLPDYTLTLSWTGAGSVTVEPPGDTFKQGTLVTLTAAPGADHSFFGWSGDASGLDNPLILTMDSDRTITATFQPALTGYALWKLSEFSAAERDDPAVSGPGADPDGDLRPNAIEYLGGTLPKVANAGSFVSASTAELGGARYPVISYARQKGLPDVAERVAVSDDLATWHYTGDDTGQTYTTLYNLITGPNNTETVSLRGLAPIAPGQPRFLRLEVLLP